MFSGNKSGEMGTYPTLRSTLPVMSLFEAITTVHLGVSTIDERGIWHRLIDTRRLGGRGSMQRWRGAIRRGPRLDRQNRGIARTRVTWVRRSWAIAWRLGVRNHLDSQGNLSRDVAHGRKNSDERTNDRWRRHFFQLIGLKVLRVLDEKNLGV